MIIIRTVGIFMTFVAARFLFKADLDLFFLCMLTGGLSLTIGDFKFLALEEEPKPLSLDVPQHTPSYAKRWNRKPVERRPEESRTFTDQKRLDLVSALKNMGYSSTTAVDVADQTLCTFPDGDLETLVKAAVRPNGGSEKKA